MDNILDWDSNCNMDNNNNDNLNFDMKNQFSPVKTNSDSMTESNYSDIDNNKDTLISFDSPNEIKSTENKNEASCEYNDDTEEPNEINDFDKIEKNIENLSKDEEDLIDKKTEDLSLKETKDVLQLLSKIDKPNFETKTNNQISTGSKCEVCSKTVYPMEKVVMDLKIYHKNCFRCCVCQKSLSPTVVTKFKDNLFCKPHYIEKFRIRGRYDDIDVSNASIDAATNNHSYNACITQPTTHQYLDTSTNNKQSDENKEKFVKAKDLVSRFEEPSDHDALESCQRKQPIDIGCQRRVSDATKAWLENQEGNQTNFKKGNSNNNNNSNVDVNQVSRGSVKNLKALFEQKN